MSKSASHVLDPRLDLVLEREIDVSKALLWKAWTTAEYLKEWFAPRPWTVERCSIDLRPGGRFHALMLSPDGKESSNVECCYLEIVPEERLVWTDALLPGYRPASEPPVSMVGSAVPWFTAIITFTASGKGTKYRAIALHRDEAGKQKHEQMGFHEGWGAAHDQLVEVARDLS
jgi:uncharacterized protein YndB with AHSA1/START domain